MKHTLIKELFDKSDKAQKFFSIGEPYTGKHFEAKEIVHKLSIGEKKMSLLHTVGGATFHASRIQEDSK